MRFTKINFVKFMYDSGVLKFGDFTLKSGRKAPYFINTGAYCSGEQISILGRYYANCMVNNMIKCDTLFGPAYKGIPLAVSTAIAFNDRYFRTLNVCFNRKEEKDHGEGGTLIGKKLTDGERVCIIEDVVTAGTAIRETLPILKAAADVNITGMVISVDRMEKGKSGKSAVQEIYDEFGIKVSSIATINDIIEAIEVGAFGRGSEAIDYLEDIKAYRSEYGV